MDQHRIIDSIEENIEICDIEQVKVLEAIGKVNAREVRALMDIPNFSKSIYDGFAIHKEDYHYLLMGNAISLKIIGRIGAGHFADKSLQPGSAFYIMTGTEIPRDTEYIVPHERAKFIGDKIIIEQIDPQLKTISYQGEGCKKGEIIVSPGHIIDRKIIFAITNQGYSYVYTYKSPKIAIISTGDEIKEVGSPWERGTIYNSTSYAIAADVTKYGGEVIAIDHASDNVVVIVEKINKWLDATDIIITTGGIAGGEYDYTKDIHKYLSTHILYSEMNKAPRIIISKLKGKWIVNLSGSPRATFISLDLVVIPLLNKMLGLDR